MLGTAALVHAELVVVPGAAARRQQDVHQRVVHVFRVPPACEQTQKEVTGGGGGTGEMSPPWSPQLGQLKDSSRPDDVFRAAMQRFDTFPDV